MQYCLNRSKMLELSRKDQRNTKYPLHNFHMAGAFMQVVDRTRAALGRCRGPA